MNMHSTRRHAFPPGPFLSHSPADKEPDTGSKSQRTILQCDDDVASFRLVNVQERDPARLCPVRNIVCAADWAWQQASRKGGVKKG